MGIFTREFELNPGNTGLEMPNRSWVEEVLDSEELNYSVYSEDHVLLFFEGTGPTLIGFYGSIFNVRANLDINLSAANIPVTLSWINRFQNQTPFPKLCIADSENAQGISGQQLFADFAVALPYGATKEQFREWMHIGIGTTNDALLSFSEEHSEQLAAATPEGAGE